MKQENRPAEQGGLRIDVYHHTVDTTVRDAMAAQAFLPKYGRGPTQAEWQARYFRLTSAIAAEQYDALRSWG